MQLLKNRLLKNPQKLLNKIRKGKSPNKWIGSDSGFSIE